MKHIVYFIISIFFIGCTGSGGGNNNPPPKIENIEVSLYKDNHSTVFGGFSCSKEEELCRGFFPKGTELKFSLILDNTHLIDNLNCYENVCRFILNDNMSIHLESIPKTIEIEDLVQNVENSISNNQIASYGEIIFDWNNGVNSVDAGVALNLPGKLSLYYDENCTIPIGIEDSIEFSRYFISLNSDIYFKSRNKFITSDCKKITNYSYLKKYKIINRKIDLAQTNIFNVRSCSIPGPITNKILYRNNKYGEILGSKSRLITSEDECLNIKGTPNSNSIFGSCLLNIDVNYSMSEGELFSKNPYYEVTSSERCSDYNPIQISMVNQNVGLRQSVGRMDFFTKWLGITYIAMDNIDLRIDFTKTRSYWLMKFNNLSNTVDPVYFEGAKIQIFNLNPFSEFDNNLVFVGSKEGENDFSLFRIRLDGNIERKVITNDVVKFVKINDNLSLFVKGSNSISFLDKILYRKIWTFGQQPGLYLEKKDYLGAEFNHIDNWDRHGSSIVFLGKDKISVYSLNYETKELTEYYFPNNFKILEILKTEDKIIVFDGEDLFKISDGVAIKLNSETLLDFWRGINFNNKRLFLPFSDNLVVFVPNTEEFKYIPYSRQNVSHEYLNGELKIRIQDSSGNFKDLDSGKNIVGAFSYTPQLFNNAFLYTNNRGYEGYRNVFAFPPPRFNSLYYPELFPYEQERTLNIYKNGIDYFISSKDNHYFLMRRKNNVLQKLLTFCNRSISEDYDLTINMVDLGGNKILLNLPECTQDTNTSASGREMGYIIYEELE